MLGAVAAAAVEVTRPAGVAAGLADLLRDLGQVDRPRHLARAGRILGRLIDRVAGEAGVFAIAAGGVVAHQAVDVLLDREVVVRVLPAIADMAGGAVRIVRRDRDAEIVEDVLLAQPLLGVRVQELPGPMLGALHLLGRFGVAGQAGLGHVRPGRERPFELLEFGMIGGRFCALRMGRNHQHRTNQRERRYAKYGHKHLRRSFVPRSFDASCQFRAWGQSRTLGGAHNYIRIFEYVKILAAGPHHPVDHFIVGRALRKIRKRHGEEASRRVIRRRRWCADLALRMSLSANRGPPRIKSGAGFRRDVR